MKQKKLFQATFTVIILALLTVLNFGSVTNLQLSETNEPTASIFVDTLSPLSSGVFSIKLKTSRNVIKVPEPLIFSESDSTISLVRLSGKVPGDTFTGKLNIDKNTSKGLGYFVLIQDALVDEAGNKGDKIISGKGHSIDHIPPSPPQKLRGTFYPESNKE